MKAVDVGYPRWAAFFDATRQGDDGKEQRCEWVVFSPAALHLGAPLALLDGKARYIKRQRNAASDKWTWKTTTKEDGVLLGRALEAELETFADLGWEFQTPVVIALDEDDYALAYQHSSAVSTPYKALRHIESVTKKRGYEIK